MDMAKKYIQKTINLYQLPHKIHFGKYKNELGGLTKPNGIGG